MLDSAREPQEAHEGDINPRALAVVAVVSGLMALAIGAGMLLTGSDDSTTAEVQPVHRAPVQHHPPKPHLPSAPAAAAPPAGAIPPAAVAPPAAPAEAVLPREPRIRSKPPSSWPQNCSRRT